MDVPSFPEHGPVSKRPLKKQAVGRTRRASTIRIVDQNAKTSPLLRIPTEVRELIWRAAIGDRTIHIKHFDQHQLECLQRPKTHPNSTRAEGAFRYIQCTATITEDEAYEASKAPSKSVPGDEDRMSYVESYKSRHRSCFSLGIGTIGKQVWARLFEEVDYSIAERDRITMCSLLGASRQIYQEGYRLFWFTNTFSFDDPYSLGEFLGSLTLSQKHHLTNLHVVRKLYDPGDGDWHWRHVDKKETVLPLLQGLKTFHLSLEQRTRPRATETLHQRVSRGETSFVDEACHPWEAFLTSPLANVTVVISDKLAYLRKENLLACRCTVAEKNWVAEMIRERLTNEEAAAVARDNMLKMRKLKALEKRVKKLEKELKDEYKALTMLRSGHNTGSTSAQAVGGSQSWGPQQYQGFVQSQQAYGQPAHPPHNQINAQRLPLAWHEPDDQYQVPPVINDPSHHITTHAPARRIIDEYQQSHMTHSNLSNPGMHQFSNAFDPGIANTPEHQHEVTMPPQLDAAMMRASYPVSVQPASNTHHPLILRNDNTQQQNPPHTDYPPARRPNVLLPFRAAPMNVDQSPVPDHHALSRHQGFQPQRTGPELFHPYPRPARQHRLVREGGINLDSLRIIEEKPEAESRIADAEDGD